MCLLQHIEKIYDFNEYCIAVMQIFVWSLASSNIPVITIYFKEGYLSKFSVRLVLCFFYRLMYTVDISVGGADSQQWQICYFLSA